MHDASNLLKTLIQNKSNDPGWFVEFQLNDENRLTRLFWMSPSQIALWLEYHDVVLNDNTAKTNRYNMPLSLFLIVNNNTKSRLVAQSLVSDETVETYKWILECTKKATMTEPMVFITDADPAMDAAVVQIYDTAYPIYCIFHISENLPKKILKPSLATNMIVLFGIFFCVVTVCARNFFIKDGQNSLKSILIPITT